MSLWRINIPSPLFSDNIANSKRITVFPFLKLHGGTSATSSRPIHMFCTFETFIGFETTCILKLRKLAKIKQSESIIEKKT